MKIVDKEDRQELTLQLKAQFSVKYLRWRLFQKVTFLDKKFEQNLLPTFRTLGKRE